MHCHSLSNRINLTTSSCDHNSTHATALLQSKNFNAGICGEKNISEDLVLKSVLNSLVHDLCIFYHYVPIYITECAWKKPNSKHLLYQKTMLFLN